MLTVSRLQSKPNKQRQIEQSSQVLRERRESFGVSHQLVALAIGSSKSNVLYWEAGRSLPSLQHAARLARFYETTMDELFGFLAEDGQP